MNQRSNRARYRGTVLSDVKRMALSVFAATLCVAPGIAVASANFCHPTVSAPTIVVAPAAAGGRRTRAAAADRQKQRICLARYSARGRKDCGPLRVFRKRWRQSRPPIRKRRGRRKWQSRSIVTTRNARDPLGSGVPLDVTISANPDLGQSELSSYGYLGGGPVLRVPAGMPGAGNLLATYHAELPNDALYAVLGLAASTDNGRHWTDLGEIVRLDQAYAPGLQGFEIGDGPLVLSPDRRYFYLYFPDWTANGTLAATTTTHVSVARASAAEVLRSAFGSWPQHAVPFDKFYAGTWNLQPGIGGASTDLDPAATLSGYLDIHDDFAIARYVMIVSNDTTFGLCRIR